MSAIQYLIVTALVVSLMLLGCTSNAPSNQTPAVNNAEGDLVLNQSAQELDALTAEGDLTVPSELNADDLAGVEDTISESDLG